MLCQEKLTMRLTKKSPSDPSSAVRCTPIYYGADNIDDFIPHPSAVIHYMRIGGTAQALANELRRLNSNETAYMEHHLWRALPQTSWTPAFRKLHAYTEETQPYCDICRLVAMKRARNVASKN